VLLEPTTSLDMSGYVDIHAHVLHGIDDGPSERAASEAMLRTAAQSGTAAIVATPHLRADFPDVRVGELADRADVLRDWIADEGLSIDLINGGEVGLVWALDAGDEELRLASYGQRGTDLLIETPTTTVGIEALLYQVRTRGFRVTLAHPERSREFQRDPSPLEALVERGILLQVNADGLLGDPRKSPTSRLAQKLCLEGLVHALATDSHRAAQWRPVSVMPQAVVAAAELVGPERAHWMAVDSPSAIVSGRPLPEAPPIVLQRRGRWPWSRP
jgi:protein-tyrosine phosphatase